MARCDGRGLWRCDGAVTEPERSPEMVGGRSNGRHPVEPPWRLNGESVSRITECHVRCERAGMR